jgi:outer membrane receptor protein involved in Fe transport
MLIVSGNKPWKYAFTFGALACIAFGADTVVAQEETLEEITVTGSRISRDPNLGAPVAVQSVSAEDIALSGRLDVVEVVREIPALLTSESADSSASLTGSAFDTDDSSVFSSAGESVLQLRGMGLERTLVLVDGRRHVAGSPGSSSVDVNTIPTSLIERVEVITGGASAIYGADAVTGVVNFIMKDDFDGLEFTAQGGVSSEGDGEDYRLSGVYGLNFDDDRGNFTIAVDYRTREPVILRDRDWAADNRIGLRRSHPDLRFQDGDILGDGSTPNFNAFYSTGQGRFPYGFSIPSEQDFIDDYTAEFGSAPVISTAEQALFDRATTSPALLIGSENTFSISSEGGVLMPESYFNTGVLPGLDLDNNGQDDCLDSYQGYIAPIAGAGGCWNVDQGGNVRPFIDGRVAGNFNQFGGDGVHSNGYNPDWLTADSEQVVVNLSGHYDVASDMTFFAEYKYVDSSTRTFGVGTGFFDLLTVAPDNPFIPASLQGIAQASGGFRITRDPQDLGGDDDTIDRELHRFVLGIEGEFDNGWGYELSMNRGEMNMTQRDGGLIIMDRYWAAIDVTTDGAGNPICRSDIDPTPPPTNPFDIPLFDPGFFTFNPGDGSCVPYNILNGPQGATPELIDWMMTTQIQEYQIDQTVFSAIVDGEIPFGFDAGNVRFAAGSEMRIEKSQSEFDSLTLGICPVGTPDCGAGQLVRELDGFRQTSLVFDPEFLVSNSDDNYNVWDVFAEFDVPLIAGERFAEELSFNTAGRFSQYSNVGDTFTWQAGLVWAPVEDIRFRSTLSTSVRAPNIGELFQPASGATFRPTDPCDQGVLDNLFANNDPRAQIRETNCRNDGIPQGYTDPLSARFSGVTSGNENLTEEEADTFTIGFVFEPTFLDGLNLSVDFWDIEITDAISFVDDQDIVDNCYDSSTFPNQFCGLLSRNRDPASAQFLGLNFIQQTQLNFGKIEASGIDFSVNYAFDIGQHGFNISLLGSKMDELNEFFDPGDPTAVDPELGELRRPELSGKVALAWQFGNVSAFWTSLYQDSQALQDVEIETAAFQFGPAGFSDDFWSHDLNVSWDMRDNLRIYGGVNNVTDENPFFTEVAYPVGPRGRYFFAGVNFAVN